MAATTASFTVVDYVVFVASLVVSLGIGAVQWWRGRGLSTEDFLTGGGKIPCTPAALSLMVGIISAISVLGNAAEMFYHGSQFCIFALGIMIGGALAALIIVPVIHPLRLITIYEFLEVRWQSPLLRKMVTVAQVINLFFYLGIAMYAPSLALSSATPFPTNASVVILALICSLYASLGGAKAIVYTDTVQTFVMFAGVIMVIIQGCVEVGGGANSWSIAEEHGRIEFFNMDHNLLQRHTFMTTVILGAFFTFNCFGAAQAQYLRWGSVATLKECYQVVALSVTGLVVLVTLVNYAGLVVFSVYADCDPLTAGYIDKSDQILGYFVTDKLGYIPGLPGLFVAAIYSAVLSSVSSTLNALAALIWKDLLEPLERFTNISQVKAKNITFTISMVSGMAAMVIGITAGRLGGLVQVSYAIHGFITGPITGLFLTAILCPWVKSSSAKLGALCGFAVNVWLVIGNFLYVPPPTMLPLSTEGCTDSNLTDATLAAAAAQTTTQSPLTTVSVGPAPDSPEVFVLYRLSYCVLGTVGLLTTLVLSTIFSCFLGFTHPRDVPEKAVNETCLRFFRWLSETCARRLHRRQHQRPQ